MKRSKHLFSIYSTFLLVMLFIVNAASIPTAQAQTFRGLKTLDNSVLGENSILRIQDSTEYVNRFGQTVWGFKNRKISFKALCDDIRDYDADPTGSLMLSKFENNNLFKTGDSTGYAQFFPSFGNYNQINFGRWSGDNTYASGTGFFGGHKIMMMSAGEINPAIFMRSYSTTKGNNATFDVITGFGDQFNSIGYFDQTDWNLWGLHGTIKTPIASPYSAYDFYFSTSLDSLQNENHLGNYFRINTTLNGQTIRQESFTINGDGYYYGKSYETSEPGLYWNNGNGVMQPIKTFQTVADANQERDSNPNFNSGDMYLLRPQGAVTASIYYLE